MESSENEQNGKIESKLVLKRSEFEALTKEELIEVALTQYSALEQLKERNEHKEAKEKRKQSKKEKRDNTFDMKKYVQRRIAFKVAYFGWEYSGFACQSETDNTIEVELIRFSK